MIGSALNSRQPPTHPMGLAPKTTTKSSRKVIEIDKLPRYGGHMISLPAINERGITAVIGLPNSDPVLHVIARLALSFPVQVIVGGNRFDAHQLARIVRQHTVELDQTLQRIQQARPFTCFQALKLLAETTPTMPLIVLDMLTTFYDENISDAESMRLTSMAIAHLQRIGQQAPVLVTLRPFPPTRPHLINQVEAAADDVYLLDNAENMVQPPLL